MFDWTTFKWKLRLNIYIVCETQIDRRDTNRNVLRQRWICLSMWVRVFVCGRRETQRKSDENNIQLKIDNNSVCFSIISVIFMFVNNSWTSWITIWWWFCFLALFRPQLLWIIISLFFFWRWFCVSAWLIWVNYTCCFAQMFSNFGLYTRREVKKTSTFTSIVIVVRTPTLLHIICGIVEYSKRWVFHNATTACTKAI